MADAVEHPCMADARRVSVLMTKLGLAVDPEIVVSDWSRPGFDLMEDAWVMRGDNGAVVSYGVVYPGGHGQLFASGDDARRLILRRIEGRARRLGLRDLSLMCEAADPSAAFLTGHGYERAASYGSYVITELPEGARPTGWPARRANGPGGEREVFALVRDAYGDDPDFGRWRSWITTFTRDPELWMLAPEEGSPQAGLVGWAFPDRGWIKRVALAPGAPIEAGVALLWDGVSILLSRGLPEVGLPVADSDPAYLHDMATAVGMRAGGSQVVLTRSIHWPPCTA